MNKHASRLFTTALVFAVAGCGGGQSSGPVIPLPTSSQTNAPAQALAHVSVTVPQAAPSQAGTRKPMYVSANTKSVAVTFVSYGGVAVASASSATINTYAGAPNCAATGSDLVCTGDISVHPGDDVFNVATYDGQNATGNVLSSGQVGATIASSGGTVGITNTLSLTLAGIVSSVRVNVSPGGTTAETPASAKVAVNVLDASGATIVGAANYSSPVTLSIQGDTTHAFTLVQGNATPATSIVLSAPSSQNITLAYNGDAAAASQISLVASIPGSSVNATASFAVTPPANLIYVLNAGSTNGLGASVTEYDANSSGNLVPYKTLNLPSALYAKSIAADQHGNLYVGYLSNQIGFNFRTGVANGANVIQMFAPGSSGNATPTATITNDSASNTTLFPVALALDPSGNVYTYGDFNGGGTGQSLSVLKFGANLASSAPAGAWQPDPASNQLSTRWDKEFGLAADASGNIYMANDFAQGCSTGIYVLPSTSGVNVVPIARELDQLDYATCASEPTNLSVPPSNIALDASGTIYAANFAQVTQGTCQGWIDVFPAGATGGLTNVAPLRVITGSDIQGLGNCPGYGGPYFPEIAVSGQWLYATNLSANSIAVYPTSAGFADGTTTTTATRTFSGGKTAISVPIGIAAGPSGLAQ